MAEYPGFKRGTIGEVDTTGAVPANRGRSKMAYVYFGTAPVHLVEDGAKNVNKPIVCNNMGDVRKYLGYSDNWADYTLCEAAYMHFERKGIGPVIFINVLDPATHTAATGGSATLTPSNGRVTIVNAEEAVLDSLKVVSDGTTLVKGTHYTASYDFSKKVINIVEKTSGSLGTTALSITWTKVDPSAVTEANVIGSTDGYGLNTGIYAVKNVYATTGYIPAFMGAPGFSSIPNIHNAMYLNSQKINGHWNAIMFVDVPILDTQGNPITLQTAPAWKENNGYTHDNERVYFPITKGTDGRTYHISCQAMANHQELFIKNGGVPYMSASNTECPIIENLYFGEGMTNRVYDDEIINRCLNANGINSAAYVGGRWVIWGMFAGSYNQDNADSVNVNDTALAMLYYVTNDFQHRRNIDIDKPMPINALKTIVAEEQTRVDALLGIGALIYGKVMLDASAQARSDIYSGDFRILFKLTTTPLAKSLTAIAYYTTEGFVAYIDAMEEAA